MNYRHAYHAGNFADVAKHLALVAVLEYLKKKPGAFAVIDTHAGRGLYDLKGEEARRTAEAASGITRLLDIASGPKILELYLDIVRGLGKDAYPGSPLIAAKLLRAQDRLVAVEKHPEDFRALSAVLAPFRRARPMEADGYARLAALLPPPERRGLILIDPPYEAPDEFARAARAVDGTLRRFATGIVMIWFPIKSAAAASAFAGEVLASGARKAVRVDIAIGADEDRLSAAGLIVVNPPFGFETEMRAVLEPVTERFGAEARFAVSILAGYSGR